MEQLPRRAADLAAGADGAVPEVLGRQRVGDLGVGHRAGRAARMVMQAGSSAACFASARRGASGDFWSP